MPETTLIVTLPDGSTETRRTARRYVSAVVYRVPQAEADAAAAELARALEAATPELRAEFQRLVDGYNVARAPIKAAQDAGNILDAPRAAWADSDRWAQRIYRHPVYQLEAVDGLGGGGLHRKPEFVRSQVGSVGVVQWNQRADLSAKALAAERANYPLRELAIVPVTVAPPKARKA